MADVGRVTPGKPIWPGHHGEVPGPVAPAHGDQEQKQNERRPPDRERKEQPPESEPPAEGGHLDEYV